MTLPLLRNRPITALNSTTAREGSESRLACSLLHAIKNAKATIAAVAVAAGVGIGALGDLQAADFGQPRVFAADAFAQPIPSAAVDVPPSPPPLALRWKTKPIASGRVAVQESESHPVKAVATTPIAKGAWNRTRIDGQVMPAQHTAPDPFHDPFGDRTGQRDGSTLVLEPTDAEAGRTIAIEQAAAEDAPHSPTTLRSLRPSNASPLTPVDYSQMRTAQLDAAQPGATNPATPEPPSLVPMNEALPAPGTTERCERIYNDRNCCEVDRLCTEFRNQLLSDSIRNISLDITPRYSPDLPAEEDEQVRADRLRGLEIRTWKNIRGEVVATGRMSHLENSRLIVTDLAGKELARLPLHELGADELCYVNAWWRIPAECVLGGEMIAQRNWLPSTYAWHASGLCHKPLYFEEVQLERYGHTAGPIRQPFISGAHFFLNIAALPYKMAINPPHECQYALGYYRPGSCAPWMIPPIPLSLRGALAETGVVLGGIYVIP